MINCCTWCEKDDLYRNYHDHEWGKPVYDDKVMFEFLLLESFQAGLSWYTILKKREAFRKAFSDFDYNEVAAFSQDKIEELCNNAGIVRNRLKIMAAVNNAQKFIEVQKEFGSFCNYMWGFIGNSPIVNSPENLSDIPATTPLSDEIAKNLKKRGFKFLGSTVIYAHLQATGLINDHIVSCHYKFK